MSGIWMDVCTEVYGSLLTEQILTDIGLDAELCSSHSFIKPFETVY